MTPNRRSRIPWQVKSFVQHCFLPPCTCTPAKSLPLGPWPPVCREGFCIPLWPNGYKSVAFLDYNKEIRRGKCQDCLFSPLRSVLRPEDR
ncbi:hypothetical protein TNCV_4647881 [Trichonephila clavipes]|uniref:Uncharacterized protein n=1 Tax=Trichonephila clavipes TaxID=2585209 RepID=A0A8X6SUD1_TRICX|nr:hypothetical protein TNCV_4647881 [Trichonephila clavipes]